MLAGPEAVENAYIQEQYCEWYAGLDGLAAGRAFDFMFSEQFLSHGFGNMLYGFTRNFYICPFNDRLLLGLATGLPPDKRAELFYTEALLAQRAPELQHVKYTRKAVNELLKSKRAI